MAQAQRCTELQNNLISLIQKYVTSLATLISTVKSSLEIVHIDGGRIKSYCFTVLLFLNSDGSTASTPTHSPLKKTGSVLSNYFEPK